MTKVLKLFSAILSTLPLAASASTGDFPEPDKEKEIWQEIEREGSTRAYTSYLINHPDGNHADRAYEALNKGVVIKPIQLGSPQEPNDEEGLAMDPDNFMVIV